MFEMQNPKILDKFGKNDNSKQTQYKQVLLDYVMLLFYAVSAPPWGRRGFVENTSSVSPACRKRRLKGRRYIAIIADTA